MSIRVLCLHGMGTDSTVLRAQISNFVSLLASNFTFTFLDAPNFCDAAPGVADFYSGPYRCWFNTPTGEKVGKAIEQARQAIEEAGPFDVVMGFSQGAALAASMLLHQQIEHPDEEPLFKAAMFMCSPLPFTYNLDYGVDVRKYFGVDHLTPLPCRSKRPNSVPDHLIAPSWFLRNDKDLGEDRVAGVATGFGKADVTPSKNMGGGPYYNMFHPSVDKVRITIPTAHVYGKRDSWRMHSMDLVGLCDSKSSMKFQHDGGHEVPRAVSEEICDLFEDLVARAGLY